MEDGSLLTELPVHEKKIPSYWLCRVAGLMIVCMIAILLTYKFWPVSHYTCEPHVCNWVPSPHSGCTNGKCTFMWNTICDNITRFWFWGMQYFDCTNDKVTIPPGPDVPCCSADYYTSNSTAYPPAPNGTTCYKPWYCYERQCNSYYDGPWQQAWNCEPVLTCSPFSYYGDGRSAFAMWSMGALITVYGLSFCILWNQYER